MKKDRLMLGLWKIMIDVPPFFWRRQMIQEQKKAAAQCGFMTGNYRSIHHFVVRELPRAGAPLAPEAVAAGLDLPLAEVTRIMDDLERHMTFLVRDKDGLVTWAYPVTVEPTPHHLAFSTGENLYAA